MKYMTIKPVVCIKAVWIVLDFILSYNINTLRMFSARQGLFSQEELSRIVVTVHSPESMPSLNMWSTEIWEPHIDLLILKSFKHTLHCRGSKTTRLIPINISSLLLPWLPVCASCYAAPWKLSVSLVKIMFWMISSGHEITASLLNITASLIPGSLLIFPHFLPHKPVGILLDKMMCQTDNNASMVIKAKRMRLDKLVRFFLYHCHCRRRCLLYKILSTSHVADVLLEDVQT